MRAKSLVLLALALGCGLVASIGITQVMARRDTDPADPGEKQDILVAKRDILMGEQLTAQLVSVDSRPTAYVPAGALGSTADAVGRRAKTLIPANTPITESLLLGKGVGEQLASSGIPAGTRLATVKVEAQSAVGNLIRPGDSVDVLVHVKADPGRGIVKTTTKTILQNVRVYAVNDMWDLATSSGEKSMTAKTVSLIVSPRDAQLVAAASALGDITLVMRGPEDKETQVLAGCDPQELLGLASLGGAKPDPANPLQDLVARKPAPPPPAPAPALPEEPRTFTVRVLAGSQVTDVLLEAPSNSKEPKQSGQFDLWKILSPLPDSPAAPNAGPPAMPPAAGAPKDHRGTEPPATGDHRTRDAKRSSFWMDNTDKKGD
jgi:pilus assembly protein CpaB